MIATGLLNVFANLAAVEHTLDEAIFFEDLPKRLLFNGVEASISFLVQVAFPKPA